jgi:undecaprenyl-diphosphatase
VGTLAYLAIIGIGVSLINNALKWTVDRERPDIAQLTGHGGSSFPSGHSAAAAACWAALALVLARRRSRPIRLLTAVVAAAIAIAVAVSRVLLGVHWLSDVVAGLIVGWTWFFLVTIIFGGRLLRFGEPVERVAERDTDGDASVDHDVERELEAELAAELDNEREGTP